MITFRRIIFVGCILLVSALLSGCHFAILDPQGVIAASQKKLLLDALGLMLLVVIPVIFLSFIIPWRYHEKNTHARYEPEWGHSTIMEVIWWSIPCVIITLLSILAWVYSHKLDPYRPLNSTKEPVMVEAIALDWKWLFIYPQYHVAALNELQIPVDQPVRFFITADAPMNSLEIPRLAGQIYAMTGMQTKLNIMATKEGVYRGLSTNFSGDGFSGMNFKVHVVSATNFDAWVKTASQSKDKLTWDAYHQLFLPSENDPVKYYSSVVHGLFSATIIKYMGPMPGMTLGYSPQTAKK